jgi:alkylated DNA nucleotide flippase Atl1
MRHACQEYRIHAARIRHETGAVLPQAGTQRFKLVCDHGLTLAFLCALVEPPDTNPLDAPGSYDCLSKMKTKFFAALAVIAIVTAGCITTVSDTNVAGNPIGRDSVGGVYKRSLDEVYRAAIKVINADGTLQTEYIPHDTTNTARAFMGQINQNKVWVRVIAVDPQTSEIEVEARTKWGNQNLDLAHEFEKEVALQLAGGTGS